MHINTIINEEGKSDKKTLIKYQIKYILKR